MECLMLPKILITREIPQPAIMRLKAEFDVIINPFPRSMTRCEIIAAISDCAAILCMLTDTIDIEMIQAAPKLKVIANYAVGYNNIDLSVASEHGIVVCNTPGVLTESTADLAWALLMASSRRIVEADAMVRKGDFKGWEPMLLLGNDVFGKNLGIIGMGRIGQAVAKRGLGFSMNILYSGNAKTLDFPARNVDLNTLLQESDFISIHAPLSLATRHLIGTAEFSMMKASAVLINTARGAIVDESALVKALKEKRISAAGLDVFEHEPKLTDTLIDLPNVVLAPHIGSASIETRTKMALLAAENAIAVIKGKNPPARVN